MEKEKQKILDEWMKARNAEFSKLLKESGNKLSVVGAEYNNSKDNYLKIYNEVKKISAECDYDTSNLNLSNANVALNKAKRRLEDVGLRKDKIILANKKAGYKLELKYAEEKEKVLNDFIKSYPNHVELDSIKKELVRLGKSKSRLISRIDVDDLKVLGKLAKKRSGDFKAYDARNERIARIRVEKARKAKQQEKKDKYNLKNGRVDQKIVMPRWLYFVLSLFLIIVITVIYLVFTSKIIAWYGFFVITPISVFWLFAKQKYTSLSE